MRRRGEVFYYGEASALKVPRRGGGGGGLVCPGKVLKGGGGGQEAAMKVPSSGMSATKGSRALLSKRRRGVGSCYRSRSFVRKGLKQDS